MISLKSFNCAHSLKNLASASTSGAKIQNDLLSLKRSLYRKMTTCLDRSSINEFDPSIGSLMAFLNAFFKSFIYSNNTTKRAFAKKGPQASKAKTQRSRTYSKLSRTILELVQHMKMYQSTLF